MKIDDLLNIEDPHMVLAYVLAEFDEYCQEQGRYPEVIEIHGWRLYPPAAHGTDGTVSRECATEGTVDGDPKTVPKSPDCATDCDREDS